MMNKILNSYEVAMVSHNLKSIEDSLGYPVPMSIVNISELSKRPIDLVESEIVAHNIKSVMDAKNRRYDKDDESTGILGNLFLLVVYGLLVYGLGSVVLACLSSLF